jgi:hypothetical protein
MPASSAPVAPTTGPTQSPTSKAPRHTGKKTQKPKKERTSTASADPQAAGPIAKVTAADSGDSADSGGLPGWVAPAAVIVLFAGIGAIALVRRKTRGGK